MDNIVKRLARWIAKFGQPDRRADPDQEIDWLLSPIAITIVSVNDRITGQAILFDSKKISAGEVANRLRMAADFVEQDGRSEPQS